MATENGRDQSPLSKDQATTAYGESGTLSSEPTETVTGLRAWRNQNGFVGVLLHYTADQDGAGHDARAAGMTSEDFAREHDLSFTSWAGKAVYPMFDESSHVSDLWFDPKLPIWRGWDFGWHRPAVVWAQIHGGFWVLGEVLGEDMTLDRFVESVVLPYQERVFGDHTYFIDAADPAGMQVSDKSDHTSFAILANKGIFPMAQRSEINRGLHLLRQRMSDGRFQVHPRCRLLIEGFKGGYRYPEATKGTPEPQLPKKDGFYDHLQDALRYVAVNAVSIYEAKPKEETTKTREERIYERHGRAKAHRDRDLGDFS